MVTPESTPQTSMSTDSQRGVAAPTATATQRLSSLAPFPDDFDAAYEFLEQRAENV